MGANTAFYLGADIERDPAGAWTTYIEQNVKRAAGTSTFSTAIV